MLIMRNIISMRWLIIILISFICISCSSVPVQISEVEQRQKNLEEWTKAKMFFRGKNIGVHILLQLSPEDRASLIFYLENNKDNAKYMKMLDEFKKSLGEEKRKEMEEDIRKQYEQQKQKNIPEKEKDKDKEGEIIVEAVA